MCNIIRCAGVRTCEWACGRACGRECSTRKSIRESERKKRDCRRKKRRVAYEGGDELGGDGAKYKSI